MLENTGSVAVFSVVLDYGILFPAFAFFLDCFHMTFGDEFKIGFKTTVLVQGIDQLVACIKRDETLCLYVRKIYCF